MAHLSCAEGQTVHVLLLGSVSYSAWPLPSREGQGSAGGGRLVCFFYWLENTGNKILRDEVLSGYISCFSESELRLESVSSGRWSLIWETDWTEGKISDMRVFGQLPIQTEAIFCLVFWRAKNILSVAWLLPRKNSFCTVPSLRSSQPSGSF